MHFPKDLNQSYIGIYFFWVEILIFVDHHTTADTQ